MLFGAVCLALGYGLASTNRQAQSGVVVQQEQVAKNDRGTSEQTHKQSIKQQGGTAAAAASGTSSGSTGTRVSAGGIKTVCEDTCPGHANNGVCDDGRPSLSSKEKVEQAAISLVLCDLGTDCGDCGPWVHTNTNEADSWRPIQEIRAKNFTVMARHTAHPTHHIMAFTDPKQDTDVSAQLYHESLVEAGFTGVWHKVLREACGKAGAGGQAPLVLDVGANFGYYSLFAAAMGCRVMAWEPVPYFAAYFKYGLLANNFTGLVELRDSIVGSSSGSELTIEVPNRGIWGTAGIGGKNIDRSVVNAGDYDSITRKVQRLDEEVKEDVLVLKVDVEGFEPGVFFGAKDLLLKHDVKNIFMEYSPGVAERAHDMKLFASNPIMLLGLLHGGYTILHMGPGLKRAAPDWHSNEPLPEMRQLTSDVLIHDIHDGWRLEDSTMGCMNSTTLALLQPVTDAGKVPMFGCKSIPEGLDPHSFRSLFGHNTNLWAFKDKRPFATVGPPASLIPLSVNAQRDFFVPDGVMGSGGRVCHHLAPEVQVMHRCPCMKPAVCGPMEQLVKDLAAQGLLPPYDMPPGGRNEVQPERMGIETW